jgi:hypothetical protein
MTSKRLGFDGVWSYIGARAPDRHLANLKAKGVASSIHRPGERGQRAVKQFDIHGPKITTA